MGTSEWALAEGITLDAGRAVWLEPWRALVLGDLHLGYAWAQRHGGQLVPLSAPDDTLDRLTALADKYHPEIVVLLGDIVHRAVPVPAILDDLTRLVHEVAPQAAWRWVAGNHDRALDKLLAQAGLDVVLETELRVGPHHLVHGDMAPAPVLELENHQHTRSWIFTGHEHPAVSIGDGVATSVKCPCFLVGDGVVVLPAFSKWAAGSNIRVHPLSASWLRGYRFDLAIAILGEKLLPIELSTG